MNTEKLLYDSNILGGIFVLSIKETGTEMAIYKAKFIMTGHKHKEMKYFILISETEHTKSLRNLYASL